uniref:Uncharacterized protein n=1 Tax=Gouania willdenowi TaxID=441366 RepID=A0A8C5DQC0_GOUWI
MILNVGSPTVPPLLKITTPLLFVNKWGLNLVGIIYGCVRMDALSPGEPQGCAIFEKQEEIKPSVSRMDTKIINRGENKPSICHFKACEQTLAVTLKR